MASGSKEPTLFPSAEIAPPTAMGAAGVFARYETPQVCIKDLRETAELLRALGGKKERESNRILAHKMEAAANCVEALLPYAEVLS